jgi:hypothetical protein
MNQQCHQCRAVTPDDELSIVAQVLLCPACKASPALSVLVYQRLISSYDPEDVAWVRDEIAKLETKYAILERMNDNPHTHDIRDWNGQRWHFMDGRPYRKVRTFSDIIAKLADEHAPLLERLAEQPVTNGSELPIADPVAVLKRVKRIE